MATLNSKETSGPGPSGPSEKGFFGEQGLKDGCSVKVAVRVRPLLPRELAGGDNSCTQCDSARNSVLVGLDRQFSFDRVFGIDSKQEEVFDACARNLVLGSFAGYNATVLAYGQTGSGKTFTMGTDASLSSEGVDQGIVPRVIRLTFDEVEKRRKEKEFIIKVSFIEIYNEEIRDLLDPQGQGKIVIRELSRGMPSMCGQREEQVGDCEAMFRLLEKGALNRRTKSTLMNESSSRSHAIFTLNIEQHVIEDLYPKENGQSEAPAGNEAGQEFMTAKFHFVDLAGSERIKKTGSEGETMHEGISINKALFVLGKVINALTDESGKTTYRPYRESNLTRILQDSLGGNSRTTMIACVSPAESNQEETLSTLLYACKARCIKNKPVVNHDPTTTLIHQLQQQVYDLQRDLNRYKKSGQIPLPLPKAIETAGAEMPTPAESSLRAEVATTKRQNEELKASLARAEELRRGKEIECLNAERQRDILQLQNEKFRMHIEKIAPRDLEALVASAEEGFSAVEDSRRQIAELREAKEKLELDFRELRAKYEEECRTANAQSEQMLKLNQEMQQLKRTLVKLRKGSDRRQSVQARRHTPLESATARVSPVKEEEDEQWLSSELDAQIKEVNEIFISELTTSLVTLIPEPSKPASPEKVFSEIADSQEVVIEPENDAEKNYQDAGMKETLNKVDVDIHEREKALEQIKERHKEMQDNLIAIMKQQYHKRVEELEHELGKLRTDQERAMQIAPKDSRGTVEGLYKRKIGEYELRLRECKKSEAHEQQLLKQTVEQEARITALGETIARMKQQKLEMMRQMKKDREAFERAKKEQAKEALRLRQESAKQKVIINKLTREKERANNKLKETAKKESPRPVDSATKEYVAEFTARLVSVRQETLQVQREEGKRKSLETRLDSEHNVLCKLKVEGEKLAATRMECDPIKDSAKIQVLDLEIEKNQKAAADLQTAIDNMEATLRYHEEKMARMEQARVQLKSQLACLFGKGKVKSAKEMNGMITALFDALAEAKIGQNEQAAKVKTDESAMTTLQASIDQLRRDQKTLAEEYKTELARLEQAHTEKERMLSSEIETLRETGTHSAAESTEPNLDCMSEPQELRRKYSSNGTPDTTANGKEKSDERTNPEFIRKELEKSRRRNVDVIKENSRLYNQIAELTVQNETLKKTVTNHTRKESHSISATPKFVSLKTKRQDWKQRAVQPGAKAPECANGMQSHDYAESEEENKPAGVVRNLTAEIEEIERKRKALGPVEICLPHSEPESCDNAAESKENRNVADKPLGSTKEWIDEVRQTYASAGKSQHVSSPTNSAGGFSRLNVCKAGQRAGGKYVLAEGLSRPATAAARGMGTMKGRSKSPLGYKKVSAGNGKAGVTPERARRLSIVPQMSASPLLHSGSAAVTTFEAAKEKEPEEHNKWKCVSSQEYHTLGIFSLASFDQYLISSSNVLKLWDINKKAVSAEVPNTPSKCLYVDTMRKILIGTGEQAGTLTFWNLPDLTPLATVDTGMKHVRALHVDGHILFVGGCCGTGALQLWDMNTMAKLCERERNPDSDIFSIFKKDSVVYYGGRNRCVNRLNLDSLEGLPALSPAHYGAVNALTNLGETLISGCREYLFRAWDYGTGRERYPEVKCTTTLNAIQTDKTEQLMYAAGKDGRIAVWKVVDGRLQTVQDTMGHTKSVNALARISASHTTAFASAGDDRVVKIWRCDSI